MYLLFHILWWAFYLCKEGECMSHFSRRRSAYVVDETDEVSFWALLQPVIKAALVFPNGVALLFAALYGWACGINIGLIFSEYNASSIIFVIILFWITYSQSVSILDWIAMALIVISVFDITYLGNWERDKEEDDERDPNDPPIDRT